MPETSIDARPHETPLARARPVRLTFGIDSGTLHVHVRGELDAAGAPEVAQAIGLGLSAQMRVEVDCAQLTFVDTAAVRALLSNQESRKVKVTNLHGQPRRFIGLLDGVGASSGR